MLTVANRHRWSRSSFVGLVSAVAALFALAFLVRDGPAAIDVADGALAGLAETQPTAAVLDVANVAGSLPIWIALVAVVVTVLARASVRRAAELALLALIAEVSSAALKALINRPRPSGADVADLLVTSGFPSGHVTRTAVLLGAVLVLVPWCARHSRFVIGAGLAAVVVMAIARVSAQAHHTSDVLGAVLLAAALLAIWGLWRARRASSAGHPRFAAQGEGPS